MDKRKLKTLPQKELRRLMAEHKNKASASASESRIESPLAKYDSMGNLSCIICKTAVRSNNTWKVHINSRQHKANIEAAKAIQTNLLTQGNQKKREVAIHTEQKPKTEKLSHKVQEADNDTRDSVEKPPLPLKNENTLPEDFFDAKLGRDCKTASEEEWEKFQKAIKEESINSIAIIAGEHEAATIDRQIQEINEQIFLWSKVVNLEDKKNELRQSHLNLSKNEKEESSDDSDSFEEYADWRLKKFSSKS